MFFSSHLNVEPIPEIKAVRPAARDSIMLCDAAGFAEQIGDDPSWITYKRGLIEGDLSLVAKSDEFLRNLEEKLITTRTFCNVVSPVGALPIVPAFIAGQSNNMRLRMRRKKPAGPLSIFLECTGSAGSMDTERAALRGAAMLALVRKLGDYRPITLWLCVTYGLTNTMNGLLIKVETTPLDLARSAHMLCGLRMTASVGYNVIAKTIGRVPGSWSYGTPDLERRWCGEIFKRFLEPGSDVLYVPAAFSRDRTISDPARWLQDMLVQYGGESVEDGVEAEETGFMEGDYARRAS